MKIRELQNELRDALNGVETLIQGGCKAFSEDALDVQTEVLKQMQQSTGVAIVVTTPEFTRNGCAAEGLPVDAQLAIRCIEMPSVNRSQAGNMTALDAAEIVAAELGSETVQFQRISQTADERAGTVMATVTFNVAINLG